MKLYFIIAGGGSAGALCRYIISKKITSCCLTGYPLGTLFLNLTGSFLLGFLIFLFNEFTVSSEIKGFFLVGFLGAYTTFSTYSLDTATMLKAGDLKEAAMNIVIHNIAGIMLVLAGLISASLFLKLIKS